MIHQESLAAGMTQPASGAYSVECKKTVCHAASLVSASSDLVIATCQVDERWICLIFAGCQQMRLRQRSAWQPS